MTHSFIFADLAGFTALTEAHGDEEAADAAAAFVDGVRTLLDDRAAHEVKTIGDAVMLHVDRAPDALALGHALVVDLGGRHGALGVRIGMHSGSAVQRGDDWFGATVNIAARICGLARTDQVLLSQATLDAAGDRSALDLVDLGPKRLRHVSQPVRVYAMRSSRDQDDHVDRDPVCLMGVADSRHSVDHRGVVSRFCSDRCATIFARDPSVYQDRL